MPDPATDETRTHIEAARPDAQTVTAAGELTTTSVGTPVIPGYAILEELGRGGMGVVYRAHDSSLNRSVALKVLLSGTHGGATAIGRFWTEARAAAAIQHRHIVRLFAIAEHGGLPYLVMELVSGGSLASRLAAGPLEANEAARVVEAIARGVSAAHEKGILHRDLKPANVLFTTDGDPKVADFGLAKLEDSGLTASGAVMGTPAYMAPEQARGDTKAAGPPTDVWALGAVLYECVSGRTPFRGTAAPDTLRLVCEADPDPLPRGVPRDLATVALKCLEKDPARRYPSAAAVADDLARFLRGDSISARRPTIVVRMARWAGRNRGPVYLAVGALLAAIVSLAVLSFRKKPEQPPGPDAGQIARLPADLAMVPPDALGFVTLRPNDVLNRPEIAKLIDGALAASAPPDRHERLDVMIEKAIGVRVTDVDRVTLVLGEAGKADPRDSSFLIVLRTKSPQTLKPIRDKLEELFGTFDSRDRAGRRLYTTRKGETTYSLARPTEQEVVFGQPRLVEAALDRLNEPSADGPLTLALEDAVREHTAVIGSRSPTEMIGLGPALPHNLSPDMSRALDHLRAVTGAVVTLDLVPPVAATAGLGIDLTARLRFPTESQAAEAKPSFLSGIRSLAKPDPEPDSAGVGALFPALWTAAREAVVRTEGADIVVSVSARWTADDLAAAARPRVATTADRLRMIGNALHAYADAYGHLPPAVIRDADGRALHSWRVELLPFLEQDDLYRRINRKVAWDHPDNKALLMEAEMPAIYAMGPADSARSRTGTRFQALVGKGGMFDPTAKTNIATITDGSSNTILLVEGGQSVHWAEPKDIEYQPGNPAPPLGNAKERDFLVLLGDASIKRLTSGVLRSDTLSALFSRSGNENVDWARIERVHKGK